MPLRITGKNIDIGDALRGQIEARVTAAIAKYLDTGYSGHVVVEKEGSGFRAVGVLHLNTGITLEATGVAPDAYAAFDQAAERFERRLRRHSRRLKERAQPGAADLAHRPVVDAEELRAYVIEAPQEETEVDDAFHPVIVAENIAALHRFSVSEAVVELDLTGAPVIVFRHAGSGRVNIVYRRHDGTIGWIDPPNGSDNQG
ncbi:ribosome hibernation-promoting factor, HPF/YfiA family [Pseudochelatococcus contaminans]|uniref:Ribosome hibernation promoting factor n=1 Tax=Pseudochelatococcus contaminans TaxID=1538103 RepID=A0A7W6EGW4_9HYPH|nr:ribosome-associated translation inhibitor RaiA [Pseudochelatococcus contaminans]MBB3809302.1 ribosomal subunit interface protein [Pseudochelatococcus contaminans]